MADFAPPTGPPPPKVPEGWKAVWNDQYSEWFFVNIYTKKSQWDKPTEPVYPPGEGPHDSAAPPSYPGPANPAASSGGPVGSQTTGTSEKSNLSSNNPYASGGPGTNLTEDEKLARKLQDEEESRARGASNDYYNQSSTGPSQQYGGGYPQQSYPQQSSSPYPQQSASPYPQSQSPYTDPSQDRGKTKGGLVGKLLGKVAGGKSSSQGQGYPQQQPYGQQGYGGQPGYGAPHYGGQPGYYQQQGQPMMMGGGGMPGRKKPGMGTGGALALGAGGGLLGGALLGEALAGDHGGNTYIDNNYGDDGGDYGGDGGDFGGDGGGDFGGDF